MDRHLHIITLDVPWPADYGGVVDLFYKLVWLKNSGIKIHLHCFTNGRPPQDELDKFCFSVDYYKRKKFPSGLSFSLPYIVSSRTSVELLKNLQQDDFPILMEGIHCTHLLQQGFLLNRKVFVRLHNVEFAYYEKLAANENNFFKKLYFGIESKRLKKYEKQIADKAMFWSVSSEDKLTYERFFQTKRIEFLPVFLPWHAVKTNTEKGCFCLYHGNLSVNENERVVEWLLNEVFNDLDIPFVVAGKNPSPELEALVHKHKQCCLVSNPSETEMQDLIGKAQVNVLPSFNNTGVKLKLLNALYNGKFCLVNPAAANGAGIDGLCELASSAGEFKTAINRLYRLPYGDNNVEQRQVALSRSYDNEKNTHRVIEWLY